MPIQSLNACHQRAIKASGDQLTHDVLPDGKTTQLVFCRRIEFVQNGLSISTPAPSKHELDWFHLGGLSLTKGDEHRCMRVGVARWPDHKGERYAALSTCGFECCKRIQWLAPPE